MAQAIDNYAANVADEVRESIREGAEFGVDMRQSALSRDFGDPKPLQKLAGQIKQHTLDNLPTYLAKAEAALEKSGAKVHFAVDAASANKQILRILQAHSVTQIVKSKSMATEEIHLNDFLQNNGIEPVETDLGEFIIQIDGDTPSHIVKPIIHKNRRQVAQSFEDHGLGDYDEEPEVITRRARKHLRGLYMNSGAGITGANFISAESGRMVIVTNEGNARFSIDATPVHIAVVGIEKIVPRDKDLALMLNLLGRSATGQQLTVYTQFRKGPSRSYKGEKPREMHIVFLDNGRSRILGTNCREILRCIRCGACQNICPVYRHASGHAYRHIYGGPIGAVLTPLLSGDKFSQFADLPKASSLCGACQDVCPVDIPIPDMLLKLRNKATQEGISFKGSPRMKPFAMLATSPKLWRTGLRSASILNHVPQVNSIAGGLKEWSKVRTLPKWRGGEFRTWMKKHKNS